MGVNEVQSGRYNAILHKLLDMKEGAPAPTLAPEILSAIVLEQDRPEWKFLGGERMVTGFASQAAVVGEYQGNGCRNPAASGILLVIEAIIPVNNPTIQVNLVTSDAVATDVTTISSPFARDSRLGFTGNGGAGRLLTASSTNATLNRSGPVGRFIGSTGTPVVPWVWPFVLSPGFELFVVNINQNTASSATWVWRERPLESSEQR